MIKRLNQWYDKLEEPRRFHIAMTIIIAMVIVPIMFCGWRGSIFGVPAGLFWLAVRKDIV